MNIATGLYMLSEILNPTNPAMLEFKKKAEKIEKERQEGMKERKNYFAFNLELSKILMASKIYTTK